MTEFIERQVGAHSIPLSLSSPIVLHGEHVEGEIRVPLATTERGLVAAINRGCKVISRSGGATVFVYRTLMTRAPVFVGCSLSQTIQAYRFLEATADEIPEWDISRTRHFKLKRITGHLVDRFLFVRLVFETGDASGSNTVTILSDGIARRISDITGLTYLGVSGNLCADKKPAAINVIEGRGTGVIAEVTLPRAVLDEDLRVEKNLFLQLLQAKLQLGSSLAGAPFHQNAHVANALAAMFIPLGQDVAEIVESSSAYLVGSLQGDGLTLTLTLPCLEIGVVGGGTEYPPCRKNLASLGCSCVPESPGRGVARLAEIMAGVCLAGELSLLASIAEGTLSSVSATLGRGMPGVTTEEEGSFPE